MNPAKRYYEEFHRINPPRLGSYFDPRKLTKRQHRQLQTLHKTYWGDIQREIDRCKNDPASGEIFVPSPWHAWAFLTQLHHRLLDMGEKPFGVENYFSVPVYRGQANADYRPIPSLYRSGTVREFEQNCLKAFSFLFNQEFLWQSLSVSPPPSGAKATAQHYGIQTDLLDITADPAVAVYFASRSNSRKRGEIASVFVFDLSRFLSLGVELILPPPVVERLYLQRGAFFALSEADILRIHERFVKVSFPFEPGFQFLDDGKSKNILRSDEWFQRAVDWSKQWATSGNPLPHEQAETDKLVLQVFDQIGYPNIYKMYKDPALVLAHWVDNFEDMVYWYAMRIEGNSEGLLSGIRDVIARSNPELIQLMVNLYDAQARKLEHERAPTIIIESKKRLRHTWTEALELTSKADSAIGNPP